MLLVAVLEFVVDVVNAGSCFYAVLVEGIGKRVARFAAMAFLGWCDVMTSAQLCPVFASNDAATLGFGLGHERAGGHRCDENLACCDHCFGAKLLAELILCRRRVDGWGRNGE